MPKTAGLSFRATLEQHFGDGFSPDYRDYPLAHSPEERHRMALQPVPAVASPALAGVECIHGHFLPVKYLSVAGERRCRFVTWLREPVARLASHYRYWLRSYDPSLASTSVLHRRVIEEGWTLEEFCLAPQLRNVYTEYLWSFGLQHFDFIGITEHFETDFRYFCTVFLGREYAPQRVNAGAESPGDQLLDAAAVARVAQYHAADMALYQRALALRVGRLAQAKPG